jgi:hypothetical protein
MKEGSCGKHGIIAHHKRANILRLASPPLLDHASVGLIAPNLRLFR